MKIADIAQEIFIEASSPTGTSVPAIAYWLQSKVGAVNNLIFEDFQLTSSLEIIHSCGGEIPVEAVAIFKQLYRLYDYQQQVNNMMNALAGDSVIQFQDNLAGTSVMRVNKNEIAKTLIQMRKDEIKELDKLIAAYKLRKSTPSQVAGDDTFSPLPYPNTNTVAANYSDYLRTI